jgi:hypothetical protein
VCNFLRSLEPVDEERVFKHAKLESLVSVVSIIKNTLRYIFVNIVQFTYDTLHNIFVSSVEFT